MYYRLSETTFRTHNINAIEINAYRYAMLVMSVVVILNVKKNYYYYYFDFRCAERRSVHGVRSAHRHGARGCDNSRAGSYYKVRAVDDNKRG